MLEYRALGGLSVADGDDELSLTDEECRQYLHVPTCKQR